MKIKHLFLTALMVLVGGSAWAQEWEDVTADYIQNPTFTQTLTNDGSWWTYATTGRNANKLTHPDKWYLHTNGTKDHNVSNTFFECWAQNQGVKKWMLFQDVTLPAGHYQLEAQFSTNESRGIIQVLAITPHHTYASAGITASNWGSWGSQTVEFNLFESTTVRVAANCENFAQIHLFNLKTKGAKGLLANVISEASLLSVATTDAQTVLDNNEATDEQLIAAANTLNDAIYSAKLSNASPESPVDMTDFVTNPSFEDIGAATPQTGTSYDAPGWTASKESDQGAKAATHETYRSMRADGIYVYNLWSNNTNKKTLSQTISNLPAGKYRVTAQYYSDAVNNITLYAGSEAEGVVVNAGADKFTGVDGTSNTVMITEGQTLTIGATTTSWFKVDNFKLYYVGALTAEDLETIAYNRALETANTIKTNVAGKVGGVFQHTTEAYDALVTAINTATTSQELNDAITAFHNSKVEPNGNKYYRLYLAQDGVSTGLNLNAFNGVNKTLTISTVPYAVKIVPVNQGYNLKDVYGNNIVHAKNNAWTWGTANADWESDGGSRGERFTSAVNDNGTVTLTSAYVSISLGANGFTDGSSVGRNANIQWLVEETEITEATMAINSTAQYGTFVAPYANILPKDVTASTVTVNNEGIVELTELANDIIPANTPVLVYKNGGLSATTFKGIRVNNETQVKVGNLVGNLSNSPALIPNSDASATNYVLQLHDNSIGFYKINSSELMVGTNRCYLTVPVSSNNTRDFFSLDGKETGISTVVTDESKDGKFLVNGQIVIVKGGIRFNTAGLRIK